MRFLIVDDADHVRESLRAIIELEAGWQVIGEAVDSQQGMTLARDLRPDVVVLDAHLPDVDTLTLTHWLKAEAPATAVVLLTIYDNSETRTQALANGVDLCIAKGTGVAGLLDALRTRLDQPVQLCQP
jgi:DNA-binding NarL/FixJ family response regulator